MVDQGRLREISWQELFPWLRIVSALRLALSPSLLALGAIGILATIAGWSAIGRLYSESENDTAQAIAADVGDWPWEEALPNLGLPDDVEDIYVSPFLGAWRTLSDPFARMFDADLTFVPFTLLLLLAFWALLVWSLFGAAITRIAAVALARGDRLGFRAGLAHGIRRWPLYFGAAAIPLVGVFVIAIPLLLLGLLMQLDFFVFLGSLIWPLALLAGFVMALLLVGLFVGWPLMWATISVEATDPFDALSRSYSYAFHRPIRYLFYVIVAAVLALLGWLIVALFAHLIIELSYWALSLGATADQVQKIRTAGAFVTSTAERTGDWDMFTIGASIIGFWHACVKTLAIGFFFSYLWSAATAIYYVLRKDEDGTETSEVTYEDAGDVRGLPPLSADALGVPAVSDMPPSTAATPLPPAEPPPTSPGP
ncbi:MAG: hypothetical protein WD894_08615 [Pirellulales bacterium]